MCHQQLTEKYTFESDVYPPLLCPEMHKAGIPSSAERLHNEPTLSRFLLDIVCRLSTTM